MAIKDFYTGDTRVFNLTFKTPLNAAIDVSNWQIWLTFKSDSTVSDQFADLQKIWTLPANANSIAGLASVTLSSADTIKLLPGSYFYDFQRVIPGTPPDVLTLESGKAKVLLGVTVDNTLHATIPDVVNETQADATAALTSAGFAITITTGSSTTITSGKVISTTPPADAWHPVNENVIVKVSTGP